MLRNEFSIEQQEDEDLRCPICDYYFSDLTKPYLLPCNHNLCLKCIEGIVGKKMFYCPICRKEFNEEERKNFQVNFAFLNLVVKILKTKTIFCRKCIKIYNWSEHHSICEQGEFMEPSETIEEIKKLANETFKILKNFESSKNVLTKSKENIYESTNEIMKIINLKFYENFKKIIELFFSGVPVLNFDNFYKEFYKFLEICSPLVTSYNLDELTKEDDSEFDRCDVSPYHTSDYKRKISHQNPRKNYIDNYRTVSPLQTSTVNIYKRKISDFSSYVEETDLNDRIKRNLFSEKLHHPKKSHSSKKSYNSPTMKKRKKIISHKSNLDLIKDEEEDNNNFESDTERIDSQRDTIKVSDYNDTSFNYNMNIRKIIYGDVDEKIEKIPGFNINIPKNIRPKFLEKDEPINANESISNYYNVSQIFDSKTNRDLITEKTQKTKKKILVTNNKVEIINMNSNKHSENKKINLNIDTVSKINILSYTDKQHVKKQETPKNQHQTINKILQLFNKTKDYVEKINKYKTQVEYTTETIRAQISTNFSSLQETIFRNINSLCDNITLSHRSFNKRHFINFMPKSKKIWVFDVRKMKSEVKEFEFLKSKFNNTMAIEYDDNDLIFLSGGKIPSESLFGSDEVITASFMIFRWSNKSVELSGQMPRKRANHSTIFFDNKLYLIGGLTISTGNVQASLRDCEAYNIIDKRWELMPGMNSARCNASLCIYNGAYLYAFRGWINSTSGGFTHLDTVEFINIKNISLGWVMFKPDDPGLAWEPSSNSGIAVLSENKILICGGYTNNTNDKYNNTCYIFDPIKKSVFRMKDISKPAAFNSYGTIYENNLVFIDYKNEIKRPYGVHIYDTEANQWKFNQV